MDLSPEKLLVVGLIAMMVLGPERLPHAARTAGRMLAELRRLSASVHSEVSNAMAEPREVLGQTVEDMGLTDLRRGLAGTGASLRGLVDGTGDKGPGSREVTATRALEAAEVTVAAGPGALYSAPPSLTSPDDPTQN